MSTAQKKVHVPLPDSLHADLKREAQRSGTPATTLARDAIADFLKRRHRERVAEDLRAFAKAHAGTEFDLDPVLEQAAAEELERSAP